MSQRADIQKDVLPIVYVIETSNDMKGERIDSIKEGLVESIENLSKNVEYDVVVSVIQYSNDAELLTDGFVSAETFKMSDFSFGKENNVGAAIELLSERLLCPEGMTMGSSFATPIILFLNCSKATDLYKESIDRIKAENILYRLAIKIGMIIGDSADIDMLTEITGIKEAIVAPGDIDSLKALMCYRKLPDDFLLSWNEKMLENAEAKEEEENEISQTSSKAQIEICYPATSGNYVPVEEESFELHRCQLFVCDIEESSDTILKCNVVDKKLHIRNASDLQIKIRYQIPSFGKRCICPAGNTIDIQLSSREYAIDFSKIALSVINGELWAFNLDCDVQVIEFIIGDNSCIFDVDDELYLEKTEEYNERTKAFFFSKFANLLSIKKDDWLDSDDWD